MIGEVAGGNAPARVRLVKGSHIVLRRRIADGHALILQNDDGRVVFILPFERDHTLIGTTDVPFEGDPADVAVSAGEIDYLCRAVNRYLAEPVGRDDVVWRFAGVRPLYDDGRGDPSDVTRDYVLTLEDGPTLEHGGAPLLSVFGGKITTARVLAENALRRLAPFFPELAPGWTASAPLPGGDFDDFDELVAGLRRDFAGLDPQWLESLARRHGSRACALLDGVRARSDLGEDFGGGLHAREVDWLMLHEWAWDPADVLWRRSKLGLRLTESGKDALADYMARMRSG